MTWLGTKRGSRQLEGRVWEVWPWEQRVGELVGMMLERGWVWVWGNWLWRPWTRTGIGKLSPPSSRRGREQMSSDGVSYFTAAVVTAEKMKHTPCQGHRIWLKLSVCMGHVPPMRTHTCAHTRSLSKIMLSGYEKLTTLCGEERALGRREPGEVKWQKPGLQKHRSLWGCCLTFTRASNLDT